MIRGPLLIDAGPLVAMFAGRDQHHGNCVDQCGSDASFLDLLACRRGGRLSLRRYGVGIDAPLTR